MSQVLDFPKPSKDLFWISLLSSSASWPKRHLYREPRPSNSSVLAKMDLLLAASLLFPLRQDITWASWPDHWFHITRLSQRTHVEPLVSIA